MAFGLVFNYKILALAAGQLGFARLLGVEMIKTRLARNYFSIFGEFQSLCV